MQRGSAKSGGGCKGPLLCGCTGAARCWFEGATDSEQCSVLPRVALFALSGCGGGDHLVTSPGGKLIMDGVL